MRFDLVFLGGEVVSSSGVVRADVGIVGDRIAAIGDLARADALERVSIAGLTLMPGAIDTQVHFREPGMEHKEDLSTGSLSAVLGGVTTVFEMPNTVPPTTSRKDLEDKLARAQGRMWCNYAFFVGATPENADELAELELLPGTPGVKIFMGSSTGTLLVPDDTTLERVLRSGKHRCAVHAEDHARLGFLKNAFRDHPTVFQHPELRDPECARLATERLLRLADTVGRPVHILHVSTADELSLIRDAKRKGVDVTAEVTPQHLWFAAPEVYQRLGTLAQMNPPIRDRTHRDALRAALKEGLFDVVGSDHAPHTLEEKSRPYPDAPSGMPGVQTMLPAMLTLALKERLWRVQDVVRLASERPARVYGIKDKGKIEVGFHADLAAVDLWRERVFDRSLVRSKCGWSPFEGASLAAWPVHVTVCGTMVVRDGEPVGAPAGQKCPFHWKGDRKST